MNSRVSAAHSSNPRASTAKPSRRAGWSICATRGRLEGYAAPLACQSDIGGSAPGGMAVYASEIYQEGLRIPALKLHDAGQPNKAIFRLIESNSRQPRNVLGDVRAQLAACASGERALVRLNERYGADEFRVYTPELHDYAERLVRAEIAALPDGVYEFEDYVDGLGAEPERIRFKASVAIRGDYIDIDWSGTSGQIKAAINGPMPTTRAVARVTTARRASRIQPRILATRR